MTIEYIPCLNSVGMVLCAVPVVNGLVRIPKGYEVAKDETGKFILRKRFV